LWLGGRPEPAVMTAEEDEMGCTHGYPYYPDRTCRDCDRTLCEACAREAAVRALHGGHIERLAVQ